MTTRLGFLSGLLLSIAISSGALSSHSSSKLASAADAPLNGNRASVRSTVLPCADAANAVASEWGVTGEWRALAPYPVPREASPTGTVGVWVERSHLDNGVLE